MKNKIPFLTFGLVFLLLLLFTHGVLADAPPDPGGDPGGSGTPVGGGSPIGGGLFFLLSFAIAYGTGKYYSLKKQR